MKTTDEILNEWKRVCNAAPEGPWENDWDEISTPQGKTIIGQGKPGDYQSYGAFAALPGALEFTCLSRTALPRAIAALEYLLLAHMSPERWSKFNRILNGEDE